MGMITFADGFAFYVLLVLTILAVMYVWHVARFRADDWKLHRLTAHKCKQCGRVYVVGRFTRKVSVECPKCKHRQNGQVGEN